MKLQLGPLAVWLIHQAQEWRISVENGGDVLESVASIRKADPDSAPATATTYRFPTYLPGDGFRIQPRLADRPVVARPEFPVWIPAGDSAELFVSSPIWIGFELLAPRRTLLEIPVTRPSDTWIGSNTRFGQLAYSSRTSARLNPENLPFRPSRAVTRVSIRNQDSELLQIERLSIPAPNLTLYVDSQKNFWTQAITTTKDKGDVASLEMGNASGVDSGAMELVAEPRREGGSGVLQRALRGLRG